MRWGEGGGGAVSGFQNTRAGMLTCSVRGVSDPQAGPHAQSEQQTQRKNTFPTTRYKDSRAGSLQHRNILKCALSLRVAVTVGPAKLVCLSPTCRSRPAATVPQCVDDALTSPGRRSRRPTCDETRQPPPGGPRCEHFEVGNWNCREFRRVQGSHCRLSASLRMRPALRSALLV